MDIFAMIFAICLLAAAFGATALIGIYAGGIWGALAFAALLFALYKTFTHQSSPDGRNHRDTLNAYQQSMQDDEHHSN